MAFIDIRIDDLPAKNKSRSCVIWDKWVKPREYVTGVPMLHTSSVDGGLQMMVAGLHHRGKSEA